MGGRAYSVTTGVWTRAVLIDEFGLDDSKVTWVGDVEGASVGCGVDELFDETTAAVG